MKTSDNTNEISAALAKAQGEMKNPEKGRTAKYPTKSGAIIEYNYADLAACFDAAREALAKNGLAHVSTTGYVDTHYTLFCRLTHVSGQWYEAEWPLPNDEPKVVGSHITYGTRYLFTLLTGMAPDEDMDAAPEASGKYEDRKPPVAPRGSATEKPSHPSPAQIKRMFAIMASYRIPEELLRHYVTTQFKIESTKDLNLAQYDQVCKAMEQGLIK